MGGSPREDGEASVVVEGRGDEAGNIGGVVGAVTRTT